MKVVNDIHQRQMIRFSWDFLKYFLIAIIAYWVINFVLTPNVISPLHQDDYSMLGSGYEYLTWWIERPVSTNLVYFMGEMGAAFAWGLVNFLTVLVPVMVLYFVVRLFELRVGWFLTIAFAVMTFSYHAAFEHGKFLGLITNLTSHFLGVLALIALLNVKQKYTLAWGILAVIAYAFSIFSKEDFVLPPLLFLVYYGMELYYPRANIVMNTTSKHTDMQKKRWAKIFLCFIVLLSANILFNLLVKNPFLQGAVGKMAVADPYAVSFSLAVVVQSFFKLVFGYVSWHAILAVLSIILLSIIWPNRRREIFLLTTIIFLLILPYAFIPNRLMSYRVFAWLPWLSALVVVTVAFFWGSQKKMCAIVFCLLPFLIGYLDYRHRLHIAAWYEHWQLFNQRILDSLAANKALLNQEDRVGTVGIEGLSPWSNTDGAYLKKKLELKNRWVVFVEKSTQCFTIREVIPFESVSVVSIQELCNQPDLLIMNFDAMGIGKPVRASELCKNGKLNKELINAANQ